MLHVKVHGADRARGSKGQRGRGRERRARAARQMLSSLARDRKAQVQMNSDIARPKAGERERAEREEGERTTKQQRVMAPSGGPAFLFPLAACYALVAPAHAHSQREWVCGWGGGMGYPDTAREPADQVVFAFSFLLFSPPCRLVCTPPPTPSLSAPCNGPAQLFDLFDAFGVQGRDAREAERLNVLQQPLPRVVVHRALRLVAAVKCLADACPLSKSAECEGRAQHYCRVKRCERCGGV